jgi:hypothetical protein
MPRATVGFGGASGTAAGMTDADGFDGGPAPTALVAVTVHVYVVPLARRGTMIGELVRDIETWLVAERPVQVAV